MGDIKKAAAALAKLDAQVEQAGLSIADDGGNRHTIEGVLDGTHNLTATHSMDNTTDFFDFHILGGHNFNMTISGFSPQWTSGTPTTAQLLADPVHDLLTLDWDPSTGVNNGTDAKNAVTTHVVGNDVVLDIHTATVDGSITLKGLVDEPHNGGDNFGWVNATHPHTGAV
jgi:hypothetical protein